MMTQEMDFLWGLVMSPLNASSSTHLRASSATSAQGDRWDTAVDLADGTQGGVGICTFPE